MNNKKCPPPYGGPWAPPGGMSSIYRVTDAQADWLQTDPEAPDYIKNKPETLGGGTQSDWLEENPEELSYIKNKPEYATDEEILEVLILSDIVLPYGDNSGVFYCDLNQVIYTA